MGAIAMRPNKNGFLCPVLDSEKCKACGQCARVCPVVHPFEPTGSRKVLAVKSRDNELRNCSASGGAFGELARQVIDAGGVVVGACWDKTGRRVIHTIVNDRIGLSSLHGSKYVQSELINVYDPIKQLLKEGRMVLFSGTPCQVAAVKRLFFEQAENLITVALICYGVPSPMALEAYFRSIERSAGSRLKQYVFREKDRASGHLVSRHCFEDAEKDTTTSYAGNPYSRAFFSNLTIRQSCTNCKFRNGSSGADLQIGDAWGVNEVHPGFDDAAGVSAILVNTEKGKHLVEHLNCDVAIVDYAQVLKHNPMLEKSPRLSEKQNAFFQKIQTGEDFCICVEAALRVSLLGRILRFCRRRLCPGRRK